MVIKNKPDSSSDAGSILNSNPLWVEVCIDGNELPPNGPVKAIVSFENSDYTDGKIIIRINSRERKVEIQPNCIADGNLFVIFPGFRKNDCMFIQSNNFGEVKEAWDAMTQNVLSHITCDRKMGIFASNEKIFGLRLLEGKECIDFIDELEEDDEE